MKTQRNHGPAVRRPDAGFGLVSILVAIVLVSVGVLSISQVLTQSVSMQTIMDIRTTALDVARAYMEDLKSRDPLTLAAEAEVQVDGQGQLDTNGAFTRELLVQSVGRNLLELTVVVTTPRSAPIQLVTWTYNGAF